MPRRLALLAAMPATRHQLDLAGLGSRGWLDQALAELLATGRAHHGRVDTVTATGVHQRRCGYRPGPPPAAT